MPDPLLRPSFPDIYMRLAESLAERSSCGRGLRVGCVISSPDYRKILAVGYNGNAAGLSNGCDDPTAVGACGCLHAEENAVINCDVPRATPKVLFCTHLPCPMCAKRIINLGGVEDVLYLNDYRRKDSLHLFDRSGIRAGHYTYGDDGFHQAWRRAEADLRRHLVNRRDNKEPT